MNIAREILVKIALMSPEELEEEARRVIFETNNTRENYKPCND